jgi:hypothetical protein
VVVLSYAFWQSHFGGRDVANQPKAVRACAVNGARGRETRVCGQGNRQRLRRSGRGGTP